MAEGQHRTMRQLSMADVGTDRAGDKARAEMFRARGLTKVYRMGEVEVHALRGIDLVLYPGEFVVILGPSGCGKSTLLNILGGLDVPTEGEVWYNGHDLTHADDAILTRFRRDNVGFVFQHYALFNHMTIFENVAFGLRVMPRKRRPDEAEIQRRVHALLSLVQLDWLADRYPSQLSGGQRQRIALARAPAGGLWVRGAGPGKVSSYPATFISGLALISSSTVSPKFLAIPKMVSFFFT